MLRVDNIHVYYGSIHAIKGVSFSIEKGEIVTLIGANGAGKSTILKTVSGILRPKSGTIAFQDKSLLGVAPHKIVADGLAQCPEGRRIFLQLTVAENLEMGAYTRPGHELAASLANVYDRFPRLKERRTQLAGTLSGGEQQMLAMGRALMTDGELILMDEPSLGLAPILVQTVFDIIEEFRKLGKTILLVEQNAYKALEVADRAYVLEQGRIVKAGPAAEVKADPAVRAAYLGTESAAGG